MYKVKKTDKTLVFFFKCLRFSFRVLFLFLLVYSISRTFTTKFFEINFDEVLSKHYLSLVILNNYSIKRFRTNDQEKIKCGTVVRQKYIQGKFSKQFVFILVNVLLSRPNKDFFFLIVVDIKVVDRII